MLVLLGDSLFGWLLLTVVVGLGFCRDCVGGIAGDFAVETVLVEPVDVGHRGELDVVEAATASPRVNALEPIRASQYPR